MPDPPFPPEPNQSSPRVLPVASVAIPDHDLVRCIGRGSYGTVWLARNVIGSWRAVKIVRRDRFAEAGPFEREFAGIQRFEPVSRTHPGLVGILHVGKKESDECFYYVMELADDATRGAAIEPQNYAARTLSRELRRHGRLPLSVCLRLGFALSHALEHLHQHDLVHCDLKPSNIIFVQGVPKLADAGLVSSAFQDGGSAGTRAYQAPEGPGSPAADVFSLGKLLYEVSTGCDPLQFPELPNPLPGSHQEQEVFRRFNEILLLACEPDPARRLASANQIGAVLTNCEQALNAADSAGRRLVVPFTGAAMSSPGERKLVTVLAVNVNARHRLDPERLEQFLRACLEAIRSVTVTFGATPIPFGSDGALVLFGAPAACEDHARRATECALAISHKFRRCRTAEEARDRFEVEARFGLGTGLAIIAKEGTSAALPALGEPVTVASRLAAAAQPWEILLGDDTHRAIHQYFVTHLAARGLLPEPWLELPVYQVQGARPLRTRMQVTAEKGLTPYVGRIQELELLHDRFELARAGHGQIVLLRGEAGIGKSRLLLEFRRSVASAGASWQEGRSVSFGSRMSYLPIIDLVKRLFAIEDTDDEPAIAAKLDAGLNRDGSTDESLRPLLGLLLALHADHPAVAHMDAQQRRIRTFEGLRHLILRHASRQPLVLVIEDLHWLDKTSEEFLVSLCGALTGAPVLMLLTCRRDYQDPFPAHPGVTRASLNPLTRSESLELASWVLGGARLPAELEQMISAKAEGNPFYVEEMLRSLLSAGKLRLEGHQCRATGLLLDAGVPETVQDVIMSRIDRLQARPRQIMQLASVIGREFGVRLLATLAELDEPLAVWLGQLRDLEFIDDSAVFPEHICHFKHALTQEVAYNSLLLLRRKELHCLVAAALEELYASRLPEFSSLIAYHYERGEEWELALQFLVQAAEQCHAAAAYREEEPLLSRAMAISERLGDPALLTELRGRRGSARLRQGAWAEAKPDLEAALAQLPGDQTERRAEWLHDLAGACFWDVDIPRVARCAEEGHRLAVQTQRDDLIAGMQGWLGAVRQTEGDLIGAASLYEQALVKGRGFCVASLANYAMVLYWQGRLAEAITNARESTRMYRNLSDDFALSFAYPHLGLSLAASGRYREAEVVFREATQLAKTRQIATFFARSSAMAVGFYLDLFDFAAHQRQVQEVRELGLAAGFEAVVVSTSLDLAFNYARQGEAGRADPLLAPIAAGTQNLEGWHRWLWEMRLAQVRAEIALARHDWDAALDWSTQSITASQLRGRVKYLVAGLVAHAQALAGQGRKTEALADLQRALSVARSVGDPALFLRAGLAAIALEPDEAVFVETQGTARKILAELPDEMRTRFQNGAWIAPLRVSGTSVTAGTAC